MNIQYAAGYLQYGYSIYRESWIEQGQITKTVWVHTTNPLAATKYQCLNWQDGEDCVLELEDLLADDWLIYVSSE